MKCKPLYFWFQLVEVQQQWLTSSQND